MTAKSAPNLARSARSARRLRASSINSSVNQYLGQKRTVRRRESVTIVPTAVADAIDLLERHPSFGGIVTYATPSVSKRFFQSSVRSGRWRDFGQFARNVRFAGECRVE